MSNIYLWARRFAGRVYRRFGLPEASGPTKAERKRLEKDARKKATAERKRLEKDARKKAAKAQSISAPPIAEQPPTVKDIPTLTSLHAGEDVETPRSQAKAFRRLAKSYGQIISDTTALHDHHSLTPGRTDWAQKWKDCTGKRILFFALADYSGSFYKWAEAVNRHTDHAVRFVSLNRHRYGYPLDIMYLRGNLLIERFPEMLNEFLMLCDESDIIHIKDQTGFFEGRNFLPKSLLSQFGKPMVYTLYGGTARHDESDPTFQAYVKTHAAVIAMTPDLCFDWAGAHFIPHNIDEDVYPYSWADGKLIMHTPSTATRKGTSMFQPAADRVASEIGGKVEIISGTKHEYIMRHKPLASIFFDQAGRETDVNGGKLIGWYGNSALEAAVFGVPTMAHLSQEAIERAHGAGYDVQKENVILNVEPSQEGIYKVMRDFFDMSARQRQQISERTRKWIEKHHSYKSTAKKLDEVYRSL
jgi:hypothetical protein